MIDFKHKRSQEFYDYWQSMPREGYVPQRSSFRPEQVPSLLPNFMIYELVSKDYIKIRLFGTALSEQFGNDNLGANYLDLVEKDRREVASRAFWAVVQEPCGMKVILEQVLKSGLSIYMETMGLPLLNDEGGNPMVLFQKNQLDCKDCGSEINLQSIEFQRIHQREFIDIGAGLSGVQDLIYPPL